MSKKIILVEDDADAADLLTNVFIKAGYTVHSLNGGRAIVDRQFSVPDVFVLDNTMPTIDGIAICKYLKLQEDTKDIPIIMISGNHQIKAKAAKAGADFFLPKPFQTQELLKIISVLSPIPTPS